MLRNSSSMALKFRARVVFVAINSIIQKLKGAVGVEAPAACVECLERRMFLTGAPMEDRGWTTRWISDDR